MHKKFQKKFFASEIVPYTEIAINCFYSEENSCHQQLISEETVLRFCIALRETFCN